MPFCWGKCCKCLHCSLHKKETSSCNYAVLLVQHFYWWFLNDLFQWYSSDTGSEMATHDYGNIAHCVYTIKWNRSFSHTVRITARAGKYKICLKVFLADVLSNNDHLCSDLTLAHCTHFTHTQTYVNDGNWFQKHEFRLFKVDEVKFLLGDVTERNLCRHFE